MINELVLKKFEKNVSYKEASQVNLQPKWTSTRTVNIDCAPDPFAPFPEKQTTASVSYLLEDVRNNFECFELGIISLLLVNGPNSPLYQSLISSGIGMDFAPSNGLNEYTKQFSFTVGLQGIAERDIKKVQGIIADTFEKVSRQGFSEERLEGILHLLELSLKHQSANFGLNLLMSINPLLNHDGDVIDSLQFNKHVSLLKEKMSKDPNYLKDKIKKYFVDNRHQILLTMSPSEGYIKDNQAKEAKLLSSKLSQLTEEDKKKIYEQGLLLQDSQKGKDDSDVLPTLDVYKDVSRELPKTVLEHLDLKGVAVQVSPQNTNGVNYFRALFKIDPKTFPRDLQPILPIFSVVMTRLAAGKRDHMQLDQEIQLRTKGLSSNVNVVEDPNSLNDFEQSISFASCCLGRNLEAMLSLWTDIFNDVKFDANDAHLAQLVKISAAEFTDSISQDGHRFAMRRASHLINHASFLHELNGGLLLAKTLKAESEAESVAELISKLKAIKDIVIRKDNLSMAFNTEASRLGDSLPLLESFVSSLPSSKSSSAKTENIDFTQGILKEHFVLPFNAYYVGKSQSCVPFGHADFASLKLASKLASAKFYLREIREIGGAYGGGATMTQGGIFSYYSYRDPNSLKTLSRFSEGAKWLASGDFSDEYLKEAKLATFQELDKPETPESKGILEFERKLTHQLRQQFRERLLDATKDDLVRVSKQYLQEEKTASVVILGPESDELKADASWYKSY